LFDLKVDIKLKKQEVVFDTVICSFDLAFDNAAFRDWQVCRLEARLHVTIQLQNVVMFCVQKLFCHTTTMYLVSPAKLKRLLFGPCNHSCHSTKNTFLCKQA
jgi:hypothetical protein